MPTSSLQPTLWRTCRVIANRTRLEMFGLLLQRPGQTVSAVAEHLNQPLPVTSQSLRALEARGLLVSRRVGRSVEYRITPTTGDGHPSHLVAALRLIFQRGTEPVEASFRLATAFTHPRRIEIFRTIQAEPRTLAQIRAATHISSWALLRHLRKLEVRGFVTCRLGLYVATKGVDGLGRELARLAVE